MGLVSIEERSPVKKMGGGTSFILPLGSLFVISPELLPDLIRLFLS